MTKAVLYVSLYKYIYVYIYGTYTYSGEIIHLLSTTDCEELRERASEEDKEVGGEGSPTSSARCPHNTRH